MRYYPKSKDDKLDAEKLNAKTWQLNLLKLNPGYNFWGPHEDYMITAKDATGWTASIIKESWKDFGPWGLDELNECVNFYFEVEREAIRCGSCDGDGYNPETKKISDEFYDSDGDGSKRWCTKITQDELEALWKRGRCKNGDVLPTLEEVNRANSLPGFDSYNHDAINRWILIETRAKRLGVWGKCRNCGGEGHVYVKPEAQVNLILWWLHPRKGCSRGVEIKNIQQADIPAVLKFLAEAADRNAKRFAKVIKLAKLAKKVTK